MKERKEKTIVVKCSASEKAALERAAGMVRLGLSAWVRQVLLDRALGPVTEGEGG